MPTVEERARMLGITFPEPPKAVANYVPTHRVGNLLFVSGQLPIDPSGNVLATGAVGKSVGIELGVQAARLCAINVLAQVRAAVGNLERIAHVVRLGGFITSACDFTDQAVVMNGASDLMVELFGDRGRHTRSTIGVFALPKGASVEVEATFEITT
ncbi:RidA family protein [Rhizobium miluonense]|uniref:Enamine deaminase RidA, house cleaning of reactive enamine intermediates, YjgF/YER057c/UK114 family n=1 Tax=Rhizobium miluonense TaxID=411945 RepID=A0A1C3V5C0_9HYPH|nr:Enamine deaminase RidA, house cleaning of reactive enamine intermediates, YjgF/YER057c/UK114 family [Rhizobium miluonense]